MYTVNDIIAQAAGYIGAIKFWTSPDDGYSEMIPIGFSNSNTKFETIFFTSGKNKGKIKKLNGSSLGLAFIDAKEIEELSTGDSYMLSEANFELLLMATAEVLREAPYNRLDDSITIVEEENIYEIPSGLGEIVWLGIENNTVNEWFEENGKLTITIPNKNLTGKKIQLLSLEIWHYSPNSTIPTGLYNLSTYYAWKITNAYWKNYAKIYGETSITSQCIYQAKQNAYNSQRPRLINYQKGNWL